MMKEFSVEIAASVEELLNNLTKKSLDGWEPAWPTYERDISHQASAKYSVIIQRERQVETETEVFGEMRFKHPPKLK